MEDNRVLCELVEVWYRLYEDRRGGGDAGELARANGLEDREERVRILADSEELGILSGTKVQGREANFAYLCLAFGNNAGGVVLLQRAQSFRELGLSGKGRHDRHNHIGGQVGNSGHCSTPKSVYCYGRA